MVGMAKAERTSLVVQGGPNSGMIIPLTKAPITLGRRPDNDVVLDEATVSRRHALIIESPAGFVLRDLSTTNGTFVNRDRLGVGEKLLKHGDRIHLAGSEITFVFRQEGAVTQQMAVDAPATGAIALGGGSEQQRQQIQAAKPQPAEKEAELHRFLESREGKPVSREDIARFVWPELPPGTRVNREIDQTVERLRVLIEDDLSKPAHLLTVGEFGFLLI